MQQSDVRKCLTKRAELKFRSLFCFFHSSAFVVGRKVMAIGQLGKMANKRDALGWSNLITEYWPTYFSQLTGNI